MSRARSLAAVTSLAAYGVLAVRFSAAAGARERQVFERINTGGEHPWLRVPQQWGTPWTLPAIAAVAATRHRRPVAAAALVCLATDKAVEVTTKKWVRRPRPVYVQPTVLRDDVPVEGGSMPSGHAAIAASAAVLVVPLLPRPVAVVPVAATALSAWVRVRQGAHEPMDAVAGLLLGTGVALGVTDVVRRLAPHAGGHRARTWATSSA